MQKLSVRRRRTEMKFALVSDYLPPLWSGQAMSLYKLLSVVEPTDYCLISRINYEDPSAKYDYSRRLPGKYYWLPREWVFRGSRFGLARFRFSVASKIRARNLAKIIDREKCEAVVACTDDLLNLPAGFAASRQTNTRFYAYIFDDYREKWIEPEMRRFAQQVEPAIMRGADGVIVPNEMMGDELRRRYGVESVLIRNACDLTPYTGEMQKVPDTSSGDETSIVYTGAVYEAHYDAFINLLAAIDKLSQLQIRLHLYTKQPPAFLAEQRGGGNVAFHQHEALSSIPDIQRQADILFLPLAFNSPYPVIIRTSNPVKMSEYLAARRPILVHAPADSFIAWYFRKYECGLVVDEADVSSLANAVCQLRDDPDLRERLAARAWERAQIDFSIETARACFAKVMRLEVSRSAPEGREGT